MIAYLLDTSTFSLLMREHPNVRQRLKALSPDDRISICTIVRGEIQYGIGRLSEGQRKRDLATKAANLFSAIDCEPVPENAAEHYGRIKNQAERDGAPMDENDLWIAATAAALGATLVTSDRNFGRVARLEVEDRSQPFPREPDRGSGA